jgi:hypothetical protein
MILRLDAMQPVHLQLILLPYGIFQYGFKYAWKKGLSRKILIVTKSHLINSYSFNEIFELF